MSRLRLAGGGPDRAARWRAIRLCGSALLLGLVLWQIDAGAFLGLLGDLRPGMALVAFGLGLSLIVMAAYRWYRLIGPATGTPLRLFVRVTFLGAFAGLFLPGTVGNEIVRVVGLARLGARGADAAASVVVDRILSLFAQFGLALVLVAFAPRGIPPDLAIWAGLGLAVMLGLAVAVVGRRLRGALRRLLTSPRLAHGPLAKPAAVAAEALEALEVYRNPRLMAVALVLAVLFQIQRAIFLWSCAAALGLGIELTALLIALPVVSVVELVPLTFAGIGTREVAFAALLAPFGVAPEAAVAMSLLAFFLGTVLASLPGVVVLARYGLGPPPRRSDAAAAAPAAPTPSGTV